MKRRRTSLALLAVLVLLAGLSASTSLVGKANAITPPPGTLVEVGKLPGLPSLVGKAGDLVIAKAYLQLRVGGIGGTVTANPPGTLVDPNCPNGICVFAYPTGTSVTLVPSSAPGSSFQGWKRIGSLPGNCSYVGANCTTIVTGTEALKAAFSPVELSVGANSGGSVKIVTPGGSPCGTGCARFPYGGSAAIEARNQTGYSFDGWYGGCEGIGWSCTVGLSDNRSISATFGCHLEVCSISQPVTSDVAITIVTHGHGSALLRGSVCRGQCIKNAQKLSMVSIEARPDAGASPTGWSSTGVRCSTSGTRCSFPAFNDAYGHGPRVDVYFS
jgi:hypothetical protein